jgi:hypothetical protein
MARSLHKQPDVTIALMCILEGVQTMPTLMGCKEKLKYSDHDVVNIGKFLKFVHQVYLHSIGTSPFGDLILQGPSQHMEFKYA